MSYKLGICSYSSRLSSSTKPEDCCQFASPYASSACILTQTRNPKRYDLEDRTLRFAREVIEFVKVIPKTMANVEVTKQLVRSSGSVGANYIEANEALGKKDFTMRIRICRKEAKESRYWLNLVEARAEGAEGKQRSLIGEAGQLMRIFGSILDKTK